MCNWDNDVDGSLVIGSPSFVWTARKFVGGRRRANGPVEIWNSDEEQGEWRKRLDPGGGRGSENVTGRKTTWSRGSRWIMDDAFGSVLPPHPQLFLISRFLDNVRKQAISLSAGTVICWLCAFPLGLGMHIFNSLQHGKELPIYNQNKMYCFVIDFSPTVKSHLCWSQRATVRPSWTRFRFYIQITNKIDKCVRTKLFRKGES